MKPNYVLSLYQKLADKPLGRWLFSRVIAGKAPYFRTIKPMVETLEENYCAIRFKKKKRVENHIGTVHVIAICNALEMAMGVMAEASVPKHLRWLPKGMSVDYVAKAGSDMLAEAKVDAQDWQVGDMIVLVTCKDTDGNVVVEGKIKLWITEKPKK